jgi:uncharacterized membrane protein
VALSPRRSAFDWALEVASLAALFAMFAILGAKWTALPDEAPLHFDASGQPDGWGDKNWLWLLPLLAGMVYILLTVAARYQSLINLPIAILPIAQPSREILCTNVHCGVELFQISALRSLDLAVQNEATRA